MGYLEGKCPKCGEKTKESCSAFAYGSPIRYCQRCKQEYLDRRFREVAIDGFDPKTTDPMLYLKAFLALAVLAAISGAWMYYTIHFKSYYNTMALAIVITGTLGSVGCLIMALWVKLGYAAKSNAKYLEESKKRLRNPEYVNKLQGYGYVIPEEFLAANEHYETPQDWKMPEQ